jgi:NAD(P)-dependent dehydrogenase (short-subunit alcohol dehydrogenase family)
VRDPEAAFALHRAAPVGRPEEVARVVGSRCADVASDIAGRVIAVNGGHEM